MEQIALGLHAVTRLGFDEAKTRVREALAAEGFDVLAEIDVAATLKEEVGVEFGACKILCACNPKHASRALQAWGGFGMLLPCNVVIQDAGDHRVLLAFDSLEIAEVSANAEVLPIARDVRTGLERALAAVED